MPGSQCCKYVRSEFQWKKFGFCGIHEGRFIYCQRSVHQTANPGYPTSTNQLLSKQLTATCTSIESEWRVPLYVVLIYRVILVMYTIACPILIYTVLGTGNIQVGGKTYSVFVLLTMWTHCVLALYLLVHCSWCIYYACKRGGSIGERMSAENHRQMFHELEVQPSLWGKKDYEQIPGHNLDAQVDTSPPDRCNCNDQVETSLHTKCSSDGQVNTEPVAVRLPCLPKVIWVLYNIASNASLMVTIVFWVFLHPHLHFSLENNIMLHGVNSAIVFIELWFSAIPVYLPHYVYTLLYGIIYLIFSGIYYAVDHSHILYPDYLDWSKKGRAELSCVVVAFVVLPIIQLFMFLIYKARLAIYDRCNPELI